MDLYSDRSWMARRKSSAQIGATAEFRAGCQVFLEYAYSHPECMNGQSQIRCPCLKCKNVNYMDRNMVNYHLLVSGFMKNYEECWWAHGQRRDGGITEVHNLGSSTHRMCDQWRAEGWVKRRKTVASNRSSGVSEGKKVKGTYRGSSISQLQYIAARESQSQSQPINWLDVYVATRDGLPEAVQIADTYKGLMNERYPEGTPRPSIDQELWERASVVKKNYVKGQGQKRCPTISGIGSSATQSTQSSGHPAYHTPADCVRAICRDRDLLRILGGHLQSLSPDELADAVAATAPTTAPTTQHHDDDEGPNLDDP